MNKVMLIGNVGADPQVRYFDAGMCVAQVRLATTEKGYTLPNGTQVPDRAEWHTVVFWRKLAEVVEKYVHKGDKLYVEGKLQSRDWTDKQGVTRKVYEIMADSMEMLSAKSQNSSAVSSSAPASTSQGSAVQASSAIPEEITRSTTPPVVTPAQNDNEYPF